MGNEGKVVNTATRDPDNNGYHIKLPVFEGPFDLLYYLVSKEELSIWDVPLASIIRGYLEYLQTMQDLQVDLVADFLTMASSLLQLKSRLLLPSPPAAYQEGVEEEIYFGSKEDLVRCLLDYRFFKLISNELKRLEREQHRIYLRPPGHRGIVCPAGQPAQQMLTVRHLVQALQRLKEKKTRDKKVSTVPVSRERGIPLSAKIQKLLQLLKNKYVTLECYLDDFLHQGKNKENVVTFMAFLELARRGEISLLQKKLFGKVRVIKLPYKQ